MKIRMTFEVDAEEFGAFNKDSSGRETTLDKAKLALIGDMVRDSQCGLNDLINESKLVSVERGNVVGGRWLPGESWSPAK